MGIVAQKRRDLAHKFLDFVLSPEVQSLITTENVMFPVNPKAPVPRSSQYVVPADPVAIDPHLVHDRLEQWLRDWSRVITE